MELNETAAERLERDRKVWESRGLSAKDATTFINMLLDEVDRLRDILNEEMESRNYVD